MTSQTKHYVYLSDVVALRGECGRCGATLSLPINLTPMRVEGLRVCPSCNEPWAQSNGSSIEPSIKEFVDKLRQLGDAAERMNKLVTGDGGFSLSLEVRHDLDPIASASRVSNGKD